MNTFDNIESLLRTVLHRDTTFTIRKVYQYDTYPGWPLLAKNRERWEDKELAHFETVFTYFKNSIEHALKKEGLLDNKIAVVVDFNIPGFFTGSYGTLIWCHKDGIDGFFFNCHPMSKYVKDNLSIEFHI